MAPVIQVVAVVIRILIDVHIVRGVPVVAPILRIRINDQERVPAVQRRDRGVGIAVDQVVERPRVGGQGRRSRLGSGRVARIAVQPEMLDSARERPYPFGLPSLESPGR